MKPAGGKRKAGGDNRKARGRGFASEAFVFSPDASRLTPHGFKGFTLLEVMVAVAILALVLVTLLGLKNRSVQDVLLADRMTVATLLAKRLMVETLSTQLSEMEDGGQFEEEEYKEFAWKKSISPTPVPQLMEVRVAVLWKQGTRNETVELVSYE